jgi:hypothetical protein
MTQDMNRFVIPAAIGAGAVFIGWIALGFVGTSYLALCMTLLIGAVYAIGLREMSHYRASTNTLQQALTDMGEPLESLSAWLARVPAALQASVRARIEGERVGLPHALAHANRAADHARASSRARAARRTPAGRAAATRTSRASRACPASTQRARSARRASRRPRRSRPG